MNRFSLVGDSRASICESEREGRRDKGFNKE